MRTRLFFLLLLWTGLVAAHGIRAQERQNQGIALVGRVLDAATGTPLSGAFVHLEGEDWGVLTDEDGRFSLPRVPRGLLSVAVEQLGYVDLVRTTEFREGAEPLVLALEPDPLLLEGIEVVTDRFERRRRALAIPSQAYDREDLLASADFDVLEFVASRSLLRPVRCGSLSVDGICAYVRGSIRPISVYVDEAPLIGGLDYLQMIQPHELHRVEVYRSGTHIRVYTEAFMERAGRIRFTPLAVLW